MSGLGFPQAEQKSGNLIVNGHPGQAPVTQINGHPYVAVDALARLMNGSLAYQGSQITLTLPAANTQRSLPSTTQRTSSFSRDFLNASIETMSDVREWRSVVLAAVENEYRLTDASMDNYHAQAAKNLRFASVAATTDSDHKALEFLSKEVDRMQELSNRILAAHKNLAYVRRDALKNDSLDQKILKCAHALAAMTAGGEFQDDASCR
jgi:hypothetical protein